MSCNYAEGLSPYEHKGILGAPEKFETIEKLNEKCLVLAELIKNSKHTVVHTGAGISTSAGIPDFRGPNGVWTLEKEGKKPTVNISFAEAKPTKTHMIIKKLVEDNKVQYVVSQNIDGLHLKSGIPRKYLAELHGNMFVDECNLCKRQFVRSCPVETVGKKCSGIQCAAGYNGGRPCRGRLYDGVLDWEHSLPENDLLMSEWHSSVADLSICLGTTLQIVPSGNLPVETVKYGGKLVICNLQPTKHDNKADLIINYYVDDILEKVMDILNIDIPVYNEIENFTIQAENAIIDWTINRKDVLAMEKIFKMKCKGVKKKRILIKSKRKSEDNQNNGTLGKDDKSKIAKFDHKNHSSELHEKVKVDKSETENNGKLDTADKKSDIENNDALAIEDIKIKVEKSEIENNGTLRNGDEISEIENNGILGIEDEKSEIVNNSTLGNDDEKSEIENNGILGIEDEKSEIENNGVLKNEDHKIKNKKLEIENDGLLETEDNKIKVETSDIENNGIFGT